MPGIPPAAHQCINRSDTNLFALGINTFPSVNWLKKEGIQIKYKHLKRNFDIRNDR
jgi:hypothetical protein